MAAKKSTTNPTSSHEQSALAARLDAHYEDMLRLARQIDASREQFNADMMRLLTVK